MIHLLHSISLHICNQEEKTMARLELRRCMRGQILGRISRLKTNAIHLSVYNVEEYDTVYALCSQRVLCVALCMMYYEEGDLLLCRPPPLAHSSIISLCLSVTHKPGTLRPVSYQQFLYYTQFLQSFMYLNFEFPSRRR